MYLSLNFKIISYLRVTHILQVYEEFFNKTWMTWFPLNLSCYEKKKIAQNLIIDLITNFILIMYHTILLENQWYVWSIAPLWSLSLGEVLKNKKQSFKTGFWTLSFTAYSYFKSVKLITVRIWGLRMVLLSLCSLLYIVSLYLSPSIFPPQKRLCSLLNTYSSFSPHIFPSDYFSIKTNLFQNSIYK